MSKKVDSGSYLIEQGWIMYESVICPPCQLADLGFIHPYVTHSNRADPTPNEWVSHWVLEAFFWPLPIPLPILIPLPVLPNCSSALTLVKQLSHPSNCERLIASETSVSWTNFCTLYFAHWSCPSRKQSSVISKSNRGCFSCFPSSWVKNKNRFGITGSWVIKE